MSFVIPPHTIGAVAVFEISRTWKSQDNHILFLFHV
jgi:hypothetical protein